MNKLPFIFVHGGSCRIGPKRNPWKGSFSKLLAVVENYPDIKTLLLTAHSKESISKHLIEKGVNGFVIRLFSY